MTTEQADRLACEVEALIERLNAARLAATDERRIAKIRRCRIAAWRRWNRRVELWLKAVQP